MFLLAFLLIQNVSAEKMNLLNLKQKEILSSLYEINKNLQTLSKEKSDLETERRFLDVSIADLKIRNDQISKDLKEKSRNLSGHIRWLQQAKEFSWLNSFSGNKAPAQADFNFYVYSKLRDQEKAKLSEFFAEKAELQKQQNILQERLKRIVEVSTELAQKEASLMQTQNERTEALDKIKNQKTMLLKKMKELRDTKLAEKLEDTGLLDGLIRESFIAEKGRLQLPVRGQVKQRFGIVKAPESSYYKNHKGIFIQTREKSDVKAVFGGKVAFAGDVGGFGKTLILDHGDHFYSVYSSLSNLNVTQGQAISRMHPLGQSGSSGFYKDPGVYFEIRHFAEPLDPAQWVKKGSL